jgi:HEAT repeats
MRRIASWLLPLSLIVCVSLSAQAPGETRQAVERVLDATVPPDERARTLRTLASRAAATADERALVRDAAARVLDSGITEIRTAAAEALGTTGAEAVPALTRALGDYHYEVRAAAATALGRIGRPALPAAAALAGALDPYLGAAAEAGAALVAIGPEAFPIVEARVRAAPATDRARPVLVAVMLTLRLGRDHLAETLAKELPRGPHGKGFVLIEPLRTSASGRAYEPEKHRIRVRFTVLHYGTPRKLPEDMQEIGLEAWQDVNPGLAALAGRRAGDRVRLLMSPDIAQSLVFGTSKHQLRSRTHVSGTTGYFDVKIDRVCEPQVWTLFGSMKFETSCAD